MKFSIIIPTYNRGHLVADAIMSVLNQDFSDYELIIVNDGSSDNTMQVLNRYQDSIRIIHQENQGAETAKNSGVKEATGDYLVFLDSDDVLLPGALSVYHQIIENENQPALLFARGCGFGSEPPVNNMITGKSSLCIYSRNNDFLSKRGAVWLSTSFLILKRSLWCKSTMFKRGAFPADDLDFLLRTGTLGPCIIVKSPMTVGYRYHDNNSIKNILNIVDKLSFLLKMEKKNEYPGGWNRKIDRLALIGGHILIWTFRGMQKHYTRQSLSLLVKGLPAIVAKIVTKIRNHCLKEETFSFIINS